MASPGPATGAESGNKEGRAAAADDGSQPGEAECKNEQQRRPAGGCQYLSAPPSRPSVDTISGLSTYSLESLTAAGGGRASTRDGDGPHSDARRASRSPGPPPLPPLEEEEEQRSSRWRARLGNWLGRVWEQQKGIFLMILSQMFAATMSTTARFMETTGDGEAPMSPFQILFVRMSLTAAASLVYMWVAKVPDAPFGKREVRWLLLARGFSGFFGVMGLYASLVYLPLAEATVITFIAPLLAAYISSLMLKTPFTRVQQIAGSISILGVVLIAQPFHFFQSEPPAASSSSSPANGTASVTPRATPSGTAAAAAAVDSSGDGAEVTPAQHALAVVASMMGVCGAAGAYLTILKIGKRAHPLISVNYFAAWCTFISLLALIVSPSTSFRLPHGLREWMLMGFLGVSGFVMQFLLTASLSLAGTKSSKGLNMLYTQMLFALLMDKLVWGVSPSWISIVGSSLILGSSIWVALSKERDDKAKEPAAADGNVPEEEVGLVRLDGGEQDDGEEQGYRAESHVVGDDDEAE